MFSVRVSQPARPNLGAWNRGSGSAELAARFEESATRWTRSALCAALLLALLPSAASAVTPTPTAVTPTPLPDADNDGVLDIADNCIEPRPPGAPAGAMFNPLQDDTDGDLCGNVCDPDFNQDGQTNVFDILSMLPLGTVDPNHDLTNPIGGVVNVFDILVLLSWSDLPAGPSGTTLTCP